MATEPSYTKCAKDTFAKNGKPVGKRLDNFVNKFFEQKKFLTNYGLVDVYVAHFVRKNGEDYEFDSDTLKEKAAALAMKALWVEIAKNNQGTQIWFECGIGRGTYKIKIEEFMKVDEFGGQGSAGKKVNKGTQFEQDFYDDAVKVLQGKTKGNRFIPTIIEMNKKFQDKLQLPISNVEADPKGLVGVLEEGSANKSRPFKMSGGGLVIGAGSETTENMGSTLTDVTFQYGLNKTPVYLSLKFGPTLTFFNSGVGGRNGPLLFTNQEIENNEVVTPGGLLLMKMFGIEDNFKFCQSFKGAPRSEPIKNHVQVSHNFDSSAVTKLLRSGIGYGYWMVHNTGRKIDYYEITKQYMIDASTITGGMTVYYGRMGGKGKGVNIVCESSKYKFTFNIRNKQGGDFPTHMMCDYKKKNESQPPERPENGDV